MLIVVEVWIATFVMVSQSWSAANESRDFGGRGSRLGRWPDRVEVAGVLAAGLALVATIELVATLSSGFFELVLGLLATSWALAISVAVLGAFSARVAGGAASVAGRPRMLRTVGRSVPLLAVASVASVASAITVTAATFERSFHERSVRAAAEIDRSYGVHWVDGDDSYLDHPIRPLPRWASPRFDPATLSASAVVPGDQVAVWGVGLANAVVLALAAASIGRRLHAPVGDRLDLLRPARGAGLVVAASAVGVVVGAATALFGAWFGFARAGGALREQHLPGVPFEVPWNLIAMLPVLPLVAGAASAIALVVGTRKAGGRGRRSAVLPEAVA